AGFLAIGVLLAEDRSNGVSPENHEKVSASAKFAVPPLLVCYLFMLLSTHEGPGARWVLSCECVWLCALAVMPGPGRTSPRTARSTQVASPG
ncbi:MAG TPA: hypothetical protein VEP66_05960, partial [Myxococcales bacterium]|nr:hypothetical protein [Myxococcales bacterium]